MLFAQGSFFEGAGRKVETLGKLEFHGRCHGLKSFYLFGMHKAIFVNTLLS